MAIRMLWNKIVGRSRSKLNNYNVIERAEKIMDTEKPRVAPRHPGTEAKFNVLIKGAPELKTELEKKPTELLDRLKIVKVTSDAPLEEKGERSLPQRRDPVETPIYGYDEPKVIPKGNCTLKQALEFITQHQNDSKTHSVESIAKAYNMEKIDVENIVKNFHIFQLYISRNGKGVAKSTLESLGVGKVIQPALKSKFAHLETQRISESTDKPASK